MESFLKITLSIRVVSHDEVYVSIKYVRSIINVSDTFLLFTNIVFMKVCLYVTEEHNSMSRPAPVNL